MPRSAMKLSVGGRLGGGGAFVTGTNGGINRAVSDPSATKKFKIVMPAESGAKDKVTVNTEPLGVNVTLLALRTSGLEELAEGVKASAVWPANQSTIITTEASRRRKSKWPGAR